MKPENSDLIQKKGRMDPMAFNDLYNKYRVSVYSLACYLTQNQREAEDLFQETWLRVVQNLHKTSNMRDLKAWIFTITKGSQIGSNPFVPNRSGICPDDSKRSNAFLCTDIDSQVSIEKSGVRACLNMLQCIIHHTTVFHAL